MFDYLTFFDKITSRYPYSAFGVAPVLPDPGFPDPFVTLAVAATSTEHLLLGMVVVIFPECYLLITVKQNATINVINADQFLLGVEVGWMREEYDTLSMPWEDQKQRCTE